MYRIKVLCVQIIIKISKTKKKKLYAPLKMYKFNNKKIEKYCFLDFSSLFLAISMIFGIKILFAIT